LRTSQITFVRLSIEVEGISRVGGQVGEERHSGSIRLVHKHGPCYNYSVLTQSVFFSTQ
jgi:hypothetical protein